MARRPLALLLACLCIGAAHASLSQLPAAAATGPAAAAAGPAAGAGAGAAGAGASPAATAAVAPAAAVAAPAPAPKPAAWVQPDGYVPLPKGLLEQDEAPKSSKPALPPANNFGVFTTGAPAPDPTGTNVFTNPKYAPAAVRAAFEAEDSAEDALPPTTSIFMPQPPAAPGGALGGGALGGGMPGDAAPAAPAGGGDGVFANSGSAWGNRYTPSVGNAIGSSDILLKMIIAAPEQQVATSGDMLRAMLANITSTPAERIFVYQTRTINSANGQPSLDLGLLFKNNADIDRTRQQSVLLSPDRLRGFVDDVAKRTTLKIDQATIKVTSPLNDGGVAAGAGAGAAMPGLAMPGMMPGFAGTANGTFPGATAAAAPAPAAEPAPANGAASAAPAAARLLVLAALAAAVAL